MLRNKLVIFTLKRVLFCCILLSIIDIMVVNQRWFAFAGLIIGGAYSVLRFTAYVYVFKVALLPISGTVYKKRYSYGIMATFIVSLILLLPLLYIALKIHQWFFVGTVSGILLVPCVIFINSITEVMRITHNNFE